jgi:hypothetical protein
MDRARRYRNRGNEKHLGHLGLLPELRLHLGPLELFQELLKYFIVFRLTENISIGNISEDCI